MATAGTDQLRRLAADLRGALAPEGVDAMRHAAGAAGRRVADAAAERDLGADRAMSGFRRGRVVLRSGYDLDGPPDTVLVNLRPAGAWVLADRGRRAGGMIRPKRGRQALRTPWGARHHVDGSNARGHGTLDDAVAGLADPMAAAAERVLAERIGAG